jgi:NNP family nitrate/nitrite transporter-like MFS transporter
MTKLITSIRSGHPGSLFSAFLYFDISFMVWVLLGPLAVYIAQELGLTATQKGLIVALPILSGAVLRIAMGILTDRIGPKKAGVIGLVLTMIPLLWGWRFANSVTEVMAVGLLLGVAGASFAVALPLASRWYPPEHQGIAMGIAGAGNSGTVIAALLAPRLAEVVGWQGVLGLAVLPVLLTLVIFILVAKESPQQPAPKPLADYLTVMKERDLWSLNFLYSVTFGGFVGLASFLVIFFVDQYHLAKVTAGTVTAACVFAGSFFRPVGGYLADRFGGVALLSLLYGLTALCLFGVGTLPHLTVAVALLWLGMMCLGMGNGAVFQLVPLRYREQIGVVTGIVGAAGGIGGFLLPTALGSIKDLTGSYGGGFLVFGVMALVALAALQIVYRRVWRHSWLAPAETWAKSAPAPLQLSTGRVQMEVVFGG